MKKIFLLFGLVFLLSCTSNTIYKKPKDLIPKDSMALLLTDLYIASSAYYEKNLDLAKNINYMPLLYQKYGIDSTRYKASNLYYVSIIDEYDEMIKLVNSNLMSRKKALEEAQKALTDSLTNSTLKKLNQK
ncbi:hypothetical protein GCM10011416_07190 [Polaribacter pacificus]|uniref:DUF4296 domain-containing protein n=1 Tax=Polaribacter pacificus TaxID=1775173 RepID=A0A917MCB3_9FLAO|nr:DUF4296 domain-containing protein [Polaribacter pacificus]GGG92765.1 hypothetical protein GCM10011416_07190 [Polaribacter pacificus]